MSAPSCELVLSLAVAASNATTPEATALRHAAGDALVARVRRFAASDWMWVHLLSVAIESPAPRDVEAFAAFLDRIPARELLRRLVGYYVVWFRALTPPDVMDAALRGDPVAIREFVASGYGEDPTWTRSLRARLEAGPARTKAELVAIVDEWRERVFAAAVRTTLRRLNAAASGVRRSLNASDGSGRIVADLRAEPGIDDVILIPSLVIRPVIHEFEHGRTKLVCFPVDPRTHAPPPASPELLATSRALADESRLRVLMALVAADLAAQEIADRLGLALSTVLHHLAVLRAAGLVGGGGRRRPYRLDRSGVARAAAALGGLADRRVPARQGRPAPSSAR